MMHDAFYSEKIESLAIASHEKYQALNEANKDVDPHFVQPWHALSEDLKECGRDQARHIPEALLRINYDLVSVKEKPKAREFTPAELTILAEYEHTRWYLHRKEAGWKYGDVKDYTAKTDPCLVPWENLPIDKQSRIYRVVKSWPDILVNSNFNIEQLKFPCGCAALE